MKIFLFLAMMLTLIKFHAQTVPSSVIKTLDGIKMPGESVNWIKHFSLYTAKIINNHDIEKYVSISEEGIIVSEEFGVLVEDLPTNIHNYISANFPTLKIKTAFTIKHYLNPCIKFKVVVGKANVYFDMNGNFLESVSAHDEYDEMM
jgi:hypothetical protein